MSKYLCRLLISILLLGLGGITHAAFGQCICDACAPSAAAVAPVILERDDFKAPVDGSFQQIIAPTVPGTCLTVVGAIREGVLSDARIPNLPSDIDRDTYQLAFLAPIAATTFTLTLQHNLDENTFTLVVQDVATRRLIRECSFGLLDPNECVVQVSGNVNLTITGVFAGVYILRITHGL
ncbi:MAG: hypothetical protein OEU26_32315 [Candidatus Tectomicrobia bacterium]|nr:hypothetical protein [Candidatus Tectomicrobia bacterium]